MTTQINQLTELTSTSDGDLLLIRENATGVDKKMQASNLRAKATTKDDVGLGDVDNVSAANLRDRSTHTGTQTLSTISDAGNMGLQNKESVNIDGGTIDGTAVNATTLAASGNVNFDSGTLFVDASENRVGIGTTSPGARLDVAGSDATSLKALRLINTSTTSGGLTDISFHSYIDLFGGITANAAEISLLATNVSDTGTGTLLFKTTNNIRNVAPTEKMRIDSSGNVGIGTTSPDSKLEIDNGNFKVQGSGLNSHFLIKHNYSNDSVGFDLYRSNGVTSFTHNGHTGATFIRGNLQITGELSKGSGSFKIDHPLKPETHHLVHSFVEGPQADLIYRGKVSLVNGQATVNIDEAGRMTEGTFEALNCNVQCFSNNESGWCCVRGSVSGNILTIEAQDETCTDEISWMVIGERCDQHMIDTDWTDENGRVITEPEKEQQDAD